MRTMPLPSVCQSPSGESAGSSSCRTFSTGGGVAGAGRTDSSVLAAGGVVQGCVTVVGWRACGTGGGGGGGTCWVATGEGLLTAWGAGCGRVGTAGFGE